MECPKCGKKLPTNAVKCNKCGNVFKEVKKDESTDEYLKKEKEKAAEKAEKLSQKKDKSTKNNKILKIVIPCVAVVLIAAILSTVLVINKKKKDKEEFNAKYPELLVEYTFSDVSEEDAVFSFGNINISAAEYEFFYRQSFSNTQNNALLAFKGYVQEKLGDAYNDSNDYYNDYYAEYSEGKNNLFDFNKPIDQQSSSTTDESGNVISWQEYIRNDAIKTLMNYRIKYNLALKDGMTLTDDIKYQVYSHIEGLRDAIKGSGYKNLNQYLQILFGDACNEEFFKNELIREYTASKYDTVKYFTNMESYSDDEIKKAYNKNKSDYDYIDLLIYEVKGKDAESTAKKIAEATKKVDGFTSAIQKYQDETSDKTALPTVPKQYIDQTYSEKLGSWAFDSKRKTGDKNVFETAGGYVVAVIQTPAYTTEDSLCYREIVINKTDENGNALSGEKLNEAKLQAEQIYSDWKNGDATEDTFSYYALINSKGSTASSGGLVQFTPAKDLEEKLKVWFTDSARKPGDTELIETDSAFSIVYYISNYGEYWNYAVRAQKSGESATEDYEKQKTAYLKNLDISKLNSAEETIIKEMNKVYFGIGL